MNFNPQMMAQLMQFANTFKGNPNVAIQQMMNNGQANQQQYQQAVQMAQQFKSMFNPNGRGF